MEKIDRKVDGKELCEKGLIVDGVEIIPPLQENTLAQLRTKRQIPYFKMFGRVYYQTSELVEWVNNKKVNSLS
ncbi:hypothetical protein [Sulfurimonas sp.]|uniref:hypothetical protein n=1 Tax=Sulfurimonas sp. TaxID=2022749 RepID=UPI0025EFDB5C|nr:hypothetical protein [Sulfurimonas sp.]MCK9454223.1 hypothetical protein [Sulfurimonas sp.]